MNIRRISLALVALSTAFAGAGVAQAAPSPLTGVELNVETADFAAPAIVFDPARSRQEGIPALKQLRSIMWDDNPYFRPDEYAWPDGTRLKDVAKAYGITTKEQYLDVASDEDMTWIAIQRAGEASAYFSHSRPDGFPWTSAVRNGRRSTGESLAVGQRNLASAILGSWGGSSEYESLQRNRGVWASGDGHLIHMLDPKNKAYGFGSVYTRDQSNLYGTSFAAATADTLLAPDNIPAGLRAEWMYRAPQSGESPSGIKPGRPAQPGQPTATPTIATPTTTTQQPTEPTATPTTQTQQPTEPTATPTTQTQPPTEPTATTAPEFYPTLTTDITGDDYGDNAEATGSVPSIEEDSELAGIITAVILGIITVLGIVNSILDILPI